MIQLNDPFSFYLKGTNGKGVVLVHGLTGAPSEMGFIARALHRQGYTVYAPLLAGHGKDSATLISTSWRDWLKTVEQACLALAGECDAVFAAGICVGGKLALLAADNLGDTVKAVALYSPCFYYDGWAVPFHYR